MRAKALHGIQLVRAEQNSLAATPARVTSALSGAPNVESLTLEDKACPGVATWTYGLVVPSDHLDYAWLKYSCTNDSGRLSSRHPRQSRGVPFPLGERLYDAGAIRGQRPKVWMSPVSCCNFGRGGNIWTDPPARRARR